MARQESPYILHQHLADMYLLATDILLNLAKQRPGYKGEFYYSFSPKIEFLQADGSSISQLMILEQLQDKGMLSFNTVQSSQVADDNKYFLSFNARRYPSDTLYDVKINTDLINQEYAILSNYEPSLLISRTSKIKYPKIDIRGDLYIPNVAMPVHFKVGSSGFVLLYLMLQNEENRMHVWDYDEIRHMLDVPSHLTSLDERNKWIRNTVSNIERKIAKESGVKKFIDMSYKKDKKTINLNDKFA